MNGSDCLEVLELNDFTKEEKKAIAKGNFYYGAGGIHFIFDRKKSLTKRFTISVKKLQTKSFKRFWRHLLGVHRQGLQN